MKILITGGLGNVGVNILPKLSESYKLIVLDRFYPESGFRYEFIKCDIRDKESVKKALKRIDVVVHLAAKGARGPLAVSMKEAIDVNVIGTSNLIKAAKIHRIKKFIYTSTIHVYRIPACHPTQPRYFPIDEKHPLNPACHYGASKVLSEELIKYYSKRVNFPIIIFRLGGVRRKDGYDKLEENPSGYFQYIDVRDVGNAIKLAIEKKE